MTTEIMLLEKILRHPDATPAERKRASDQLAAAAALAAAENAKRPKIAWPS